MTSKPESRSEPSSPQNFNLGGDLPIRRLGFGTMRLVGEGAWGEPERGRPNAIAVLRRAVDLGVNLLDTADAYGPHLAEELIAKALYPYPAGLVIATKGGLFRMGPGKSKPCGLPAYLTQSVELSLRRLRLDCIPLYQLHRIDPNVPVEDTLGALRDLQGQGKIRHIGLSEVSSEEIERAVRVTPIVSVQNRYSLAERKSERTLDFCTSRNIAFLPWYPLNAQKAGTLLHPGGAIDTFARERNLTLQQLALAWLLARSPVICPIPGTSSVEHLEQNMQSDHLDLPASTWDDLELVLDTQSS